MAVNTETVLTARIRKEQTIPLEKSVAREKIKLDKQHAQIAIEDVNQNINKKMNLEIEYATETDGENLIFKGAEARFSGLPYIVSSFFTGFIGGCDELLSGLNNIDYLREIVEIYEKSGVNDAIEETKTPGEDEGLRSLDEIEIGDGIIFAEAVGSNGMPRPMLDVDMQLTHNSRDDSETGLSLSREFLEIANEVGIQTTGIEDEYIGDQYAIGLKNPEIDAARFYEYSERLSEYDEAVILNTEINRKMQNKVNDMMG